MICAYGIYAVVRDQGKHGQVCTKHVIRKSAIPGGPERLVWVYGVHRTQGNACDGAEHKRVGGIW